jgi:pentose-5-phosphate-3-epimerase
MNVLGYRNFMFSQAEGLTFHAEAHTSKNRGLVKLLGSYNLKVDISIFSKIDILNQVIQSLLTSSPV